MFVLSSNRGGRGGGKLWHIVCVSARCGDCQCVYLPSLHIQYINIYMEYSECVYSYMNLIGIFDILFEYFNENYIFFMLLFEI